ncbi:hypothetical protein GCM10010193_42740 [Kitasatospora atroaurantiaca]
MDTCRKGGSLVAAAASGAGGGTFVTLVQQGVRPGRAGGRTIAGAMLVRVSGTVCTAVSLDRWNMPEALAVTDPSDHPEAYS